MASNPGPKNTAQAENKRLVPEASSDTPSPEQATGEQQGTIEKRDVPQPSPEQLPPSHEQEATREAQEQPPDHETEGGFDDAVQQLKRKLKRPKDTSTDQAQRPIVRDEMTKQIEQVMQEGLEDAYAELTPVQRQEFKIKGEQTAQSIRDLMRGSHIKVKKVFALLVEWLKLLPGVNRFFLEQEAKIKTDHILSLKEVYKKNHK